MTMPRWVGVSAAVAAATLFAIAGTAHGQVASDTCAGAPLITTGTFTGSTLGATSDGSAGCGSSTTAPDRWYRITPDSDQTLNVQTCGSSYDTVLSIHTGCPGTSANQIVCNDDACGLQSVVNVPVSAGETYYIRVSGYSSSAGSYTMSVSYLAPPPPGSGPDVTYQNINGIAQYTAVGGIVAYALGTDTCNIGNQNLSWTNGGTPGVGFNAYRLYGGRLEQLGQSWAKIACCAAVGNGCGLACNGQGGSVLGAGCLDVYGASYNGGHSGLRPRSMINPWSGLFSGTISGPTGSIDRRMQVQTSDLSAAAFPGALYFVEGVYVATDEGPEAKLNNASHRRVTVSGTTLTLASTSPMRATVPAIYAWREHGLGVNTPDPSVAIEPVDVTGEGRFIVGHRVRDNGNGTWRYEYAVFNLNSHRSGGSFSVPVGSGAAVTNAGFNGVPYHSGEPYDNTDWSVSITGDAVMWSSPQTFDQNANTNALRWGTMYNFWFDADRPPADADVTLGLFRPGTPSAVTLSVGTPTGGSCAADWNGDEMVNSNDISAFITTWLGNVAGGGLEADFNGDLVVNSNDISAFITAWLDAVQNGC